MTTQAPPKLVCVAAVAAPHGVRGAFKLRCFTATPEGATAYGPVCDERGRELFTLLPVGTTPGGIIARTPGIDSREAAAALRGQRLYVPRERLPPLLDEDEFYLEDLVGLEAVDAAGRGLGRVAAVHDFGAGDLLEIEGGEAGPLILPFTRAIVPEVDLDRGRVVIVPPAEIEADRPVAAP